MSDPHTLHAVFIGELRTSYDGERQLVLSLRHLLRATRNPELHAAVATHLQETIARVDNLAQVFAILDLAARGQNRADSGAAEGGWDAIERLARAAARDADLNDTEVGDVGPDNTALAAPRTGIEASELSSYGSLIATATTLGYRNVVQLLERNLGQPVVADRSMARRGTGGRAVTSQPSAQVA